MNTPIERELGRVLRDHAASIDVMPDYRLEPAEVRPDGRRGDRGAPRRMWMLVVSGAAIVATVAAGIVGARFGLLPNRRPSGQSSSCVAATSTRFMTALRGGALPVGDVVLSVARDGTLLVAAEGDGVATAVRAMSPDGTVSTLWAARAGDRLRAVANPSGAINATSAAFVLVPVGSSGPAQVYAADMYHHTLKTVTIDAGYRVSTDAATAPIAMGDSVDMVEMSVSDPRVQQLAQVWVDTPLNLRTSHTRTSRVTALLAVGGNIVTIRTLATGATVADFDQPRYRPSTVPPAVRNGYAFASDDTTMTWLGTVAGHHTLWRWTPGDPSPTGHALPDTFVPMRAAGRFAAAAPAGGHQQLVDSLSDRVIVLPPGVTLARLGTVNAVLAVRTVHGLRYARIPIQALDTC